MFKSNKESGKKSDGGRSGGKKFPPTIIAANVNMLGSIVSDGELDIDGSVEGNVRCNSLVLRKNGRIYGDVVAHNLQVFGEIDGTVRAKEVGLYKSALVKGSIIHETLAIEDGASIDGKLKKQDKVSLDEVSGDDDPTELLKRFKIIDE